MQPSLAVQFVMGRWPEVVACVERERSSFPYLWGASKQQRYFECTTPNAGFQDALAGLLPLGVVPAAIVATADAGEVVLGGVFVGACVADDGLRGWLSLCRERGLILLGTGRVMGSVVDGLRFVVRVEGPMPTRSQLARYGARE